MSRETDSYLNSLEEGKLEYLKSRELQLSLPYLILIYFAMLGTKRCIYQASALPVSYILILNVPLLNKVGAILRSDPASDEYTVFKKWHRYLLLCKINIL